MSIDDFATSILKLLLKRYPNRPIKGPRSIRLRAAIPCIARS
jgi:hypothetical protein